MAGGSRKGKEKIGDESRLRKSWGSRSESSQSRDSQSSTPTDESKLCPDMAVSSMTDAELVRLQEQHGIPKQF